MSGAGSAAGDRIPAECRVIEVRVAELRQLFNAIDPSPFRDRDLDSRAEEFIVEWARDVPRDAPLALLVHLERSAGPAEEGALLGEAIHQYFGQRAVGSRRRLRDLFRRGRISLAIALAFLAASTALGDAVAGSMHASRFAGVIREGLLIGGWVAMWRPLEVFLYDWWPVRAEARLFDRLSTMPVRIEYQERTAADAWRHDWPAVPAAEPRSPSRRGHGGGRGGGPEVHVDDTDDHHSPNEERRNREAALDRTIEQSFPASDPASSNPNPDDESVLDRPHEKEAEANRASPDR